MPVAHVMCVIFSSIDSGGSADQRHRGGRTRLGS
jgi:hypothetical protein